MKSAAREGGRFVSSYVTDVKEGPYCTVEHACLPAGYKILSVDASLKEGVHVYEMRLSSSGSFGELQFHDVDAFLDTTRTMFRETGAFISYGPGLNDSLQAIIDNAIHDSEPIPPGYYAGAMATAAATAIKATEALHEYIGKAPPTPEKQLDAGEEAVRNVIIGTLKETGGDVLRASVKLRISAHDALYNALDRISNGCVIQLYRANGIPLDFLMKRRGKNRRIDRMFLAEGAA